MRKKLNYILSVVFALSICMPAGGVSLAGEAEPLLTSQQADSVALQDSADADSADLQSDAAVETDREALSADSGEAATEAPSADEGQPSENAQEGAVQDGSIVDNDAAISGNAAVEAPSADEGQPSDNPQESAVQDSLAADSDVAVTAQESPQQLQDVIVDGMVFTPVWDDGGQTGGYALSKYTGDGTTLDIPAQITGSDGSSHPVTAIDQDLQGYKKIEHLTIPDSVTEVTNSAFVDCTNLQSVKIGSAVEKLEWTFKGCTALVEVTFSDNSSLKTLYNAFSGCSSLESLALPDGLEEVGLRGSSGLQQVTLPDSITKIYSYGFHNCRNLTSINIPDGVTAIDKGTFFNCPNLTTITGGANVTSIGERCFGGYDSATGAWVQDEKLTSLGDIDFSKLTSIGGYAFYGAVNLPNNDLSLDSVTSLGKYAFHNINWITKLALGDGLEVIPEGAFGFCYNITDIVIPNSVKTIDKDAFKSADAAIIAIGSNDASQLESIGEDAFADQQSGSAITINAAKPSVNLKANSFGALDTVTWTVASVDETGKVLYLDGGAGNDANDGTAKDKAVKTFARAKELATANQDILYINVIGTTKVSGDVSLDGTNAMLRRDADFGGYLLQVTEGDTSTLKDITVDGNAKKASANRALILVQGATLNIQDGTILQNNKRIDLGWYEGFGGAIYVDGSSSESTVNMSGGIIQNNTAKGGGGISVDCGGTFNMTGGTISNNHAITGTTGGIDSYAGGGGVALAGRYDVSGKPMIFNFSGGTIEGNSSEEWGGGICLGWGRSGNNQTILNMTGGTVQNNTAGSGGGGILVQYGLDEKGSSHASYGVANISGGSIINNQMLGNGHGENGFGGGGIYVNGGPAESQGYFFHNAELNLTNALITDNTAALEGGGYAACPVSETHLYVKNGVALYGNTGSSAKELYILASLWYGPHSGSPHYTISDSMLGGTPYNWKYDDGTEVPLNVLEGVLSGSIGEQLSLHTDVTSDAAAQALASVIISGNTSVTRGGGIGSNGTVTMGTSDEIEIPVHKSWEDGDNPGRPQSVTVELYRTTEGATGEPVYVGYETITPDNNGAWELSFKNLPKTDSNGAEYVYTVKEHTVDGYTALITGNQVDGFEIKNALSTSISVIKKWVGPMGTEVSVKLLADGTEVPGQELVLNDANDWSGSFDNLPKYDDTDGHEIAYTVSEAEVPQGYSVSVTGDASSGFTITNTNTETVNVPVAKKWVGPAGTEVSVKLLADGAEVPGQELVLNDTNSWSGSFDNLPKYDAGDGHEIVYAVSEAEVSGVDASKYTMSVTGDVTSGFIITNTNIETVDIAGTKTWNDDENRDGARPDSITVRLLADDLEVDSVTVTPATDGSWSYSFVGLAKYDAADGHEIAYTVKEDAVPNYTASIAGTDITNSYTPGKTSISVSKVWNDAGDQDGIRPDSVTVQLLANGKPFGDAVVLNESNQWTYTWAGLFEKEAGQDVVYTVEEVEVPNGYAVKITGDATTGFILTNTHTPETISIPVTKTWVGGKGSPVTIRLSANGEATGLHMELNESNGWKGTFADLPKFSGGKEIAYTISEDPVQGYTSKISGDVNSGFTVTNSKEDVPGKPTKPNGGDIPKTGDQTSSVPSVLLTVTSLATFLAAAFILRRRSAAHLDTSDSERR